MGSQSDLPTLKATIKILKEFNVPYEAEVLSAHRSPKELFRFTERAKDRGIKVIIAGAGGAAALAGMIAAHTTLPVIGVPVETISLKGLDSLLSTVQMPSGVPVACMAIGKSGAKNAALFALEILGINDRKIQKELEKYKKNLAKTIKKLRR
jgi:phosphoribosylaminoimidazole carboxylase PurE protein